MRRIAGPIGTALALLAACGSPEPPGTPEPPPSVSTGAATTASAGRLSTSPGPTTGPAASASAATGSSSAKTSTGKPPTAKPPTPPTPPKATTAKPPAKGSPVRTAPIDIVGSSYAQTGPLTEAELADECGGSLCVTLRTTVEGPPDPQVDCKVERIVQTVPIYRGDTITFVLTDECGGFTEPPPPTE